MVKFICIYSYNMVNYPHQKAQWACFFNIFFPHFAGINNFYFYYENLISSVGELILTVLFYRLMFSYYLFFAIRLIFFNGVIRRKVFCFLLHTFFTPFKSCFNYKYRQTLKNDKLKNEFWIINNSDTVRSKIFIF